MYKEEERKEEKKKQSFGAAVCIEWQ